MLYVFVLCFNSHSCFALSLHLSCTLPTQHMTFDDLACWPPHLTLFDLVKSTRLLHTICDLLLQIITWINEKNMQHDNFKYINLFWIWNDPVMTFGLHNNLWTTWWPSSSAWPWPRVWPFPVLMTSMTSFGCIWKSSKTGWPCDVVKNTLDNSNAFCVAMMTLTPPVTFGGLGDLNIWMTFTTCVSSIHRDDLDCPRDLGTIVTTEITWITFGCPNFDKNLNDHGTTLWPWHIVWPLRIVWPWLVMMTLLTLQEPAPMMMLQPPTGLGSFDKVWPRILFIIGCDSSYITFLT